jgi:hypothetical protein
MNNYQRTADNSILQTFCLPMELVGADECDVNSKCDTILRSKVMIPTPLDLHTKVSITKVKPLSITSVPFNFTTKERIPYLSESKFNNAMYAFLDPNDYIYVLSNSDNKLLECLTVTGVFENPLELKNFHNCCNCTSIDTICFNEDTTDYPLQPHLIDLIRREIVSELVDRLNIPEDKENNSID